MPPNKQASAPIPKEQRPINEYQELCGSFFFRWATIEPRRYIVGLVAVWSGAWLISGPVAAFSFEPTTAPLLFFLAGAEFVGSMQLMIYVGGTLVLVSGIALHLLRTGYKIRN